MAGWRGEGTARQEDGGAGSPFGFYPKSGGKPAEGLKQEGCDLPASSCKDRVGFSVPLP